MTGIAISYRREDTGWITGRIFDRLKDHYEKSKTRSDRNKAVVFMDYDSTPVGVDFRKYIKGVLNECDVLLAVIGPHWTGDDGKGELRIMREGDWVRIEIETALASNIPVVPVLIDRTPMPSAGMLPEGVRELVYRQAAVVDTQIDFNSHVDRLIREIDRLIGLGAPPREARPSPEEIRVSSALRGTGTPEDDRAMPFAVSVRGVSSEGGQVRTGIQQISRPIVAYGLLSVLVCALTASLLLYFFGQKKFAVEPAYTGYSSPELGVTTIFPNNIFTLDTTERKQRKLVLRDGDGQPAIKILRTALPEHRDVKLGRQNESAELTRMNFTVTYMAPEKEQNWSNWYVLSGVNRGTEFYFRRWYLEDSMVSIEFMYTKELAPLFDKIIPTMTRELMMSKVAPRIEP